PAKASARSGSPGMLRSFGKPAKGRQSGLPTKRDRFQQIGSARKKTAFAESGQTASHTEGAGRQAIHGRRSPAAAAVGPEPRLSSQTEEFLVNAAFLLVTTAWLAGADPPAPSAATVDPPAATASWCCDAGCKGACGSSCDTCRRGLFSRLRDWFHSRHCCENTCCDSACDGTTVTPGGTIVPGPGRAEPLAPPKDAPKKMPSPAKETL